MAKGKHPTGGIDLTQQQFGVDSSVGDLVRRHRLGASIVDPTATRRPIWGDFTAVDFQKYQDTILDVQRHFSALPSNVRRHFANQPYQLFRLMDQVHAGDPAAISQALKLGLVNKHEVAETIKEGLKADPEANPHKKETSE